MTLTTTMPNYRPGGRPSDLMKGMLGKPFTFQGKTYTVGKPNPGVTGQSITLSEAWAMFEGLSSKCPDGISANGAFMTEQGHWPLPTCANWAGDKAILGIGQCDAKLARGLHVEGLNGPRGVVCTRALVHPGIGTRAGVLVQKRIRCKGEKFASKKFASKKFASVWKCSQFKAAKCLVIPQGKIPMDKLPGAHGRLARLYFPGGYWPNIAGKSTKRRMCGGKAECSVSTKVPRKDWSYSMYPARSGDEDCDVHSNGIVPDFRTCVTRAEDVYRSKKLWGRAATLLLKVGESDPSFLAKYSCKGKIAHFVSSHIVFRGVRPGPFHHSAKMRKIFKDVVKSVLGPGVFTQFRSYHAPPWDCHPRCRTWTSPKTKLVVDFKVSSAAKAKSAVKAARALFQSSKFLATLKKKGKAAGISWLVDQITKIDRARGSWEENVRAITGQDHFTDEYLDGIYPPLCYPDPKGEEKKSYGRHYKPCPHWMALRRKTHREFVMNTEGFLALS